MEWILERPVLIGLLIFVSIVVFLGSWMVYGKWRRSPKKTVQPAKKRVWMSWTQGLTWKAPKFSTILTWVVVIWLLLVAGPWVLPYIFWELPKASIEARIGKSEQYYVVPSIRSRTENEDRVQFFVNSPRKLGWKVLPTEVDFDIPLDGIPRYSGLNIAFLGGSRVNIVCPGYWSGGKVKLYAKGGEASFIHLGHENSLPIVESGSVTGGGAILVKGVKDKRYEAISNLIHAEVEPLPGHHRIATTKVCDAGLVYDWGTVQFGTRADSPPWQIYVRFADENGITLKPSVTQQKPGQIFFGVMENGKLQEAYSDIVSKAANIYGSYSVPRWAKNPFLRIQTPNIEEGKVIVEVILDIDNTR